MTATASLPARPFQSLSPSRAQDFLSCPLLYRFRVIDRLEEPPNPAAVRGTLVHGVLEQLFDLPASERTVESALALVAPLWAEAVSSRPEVADIARVGGMDEREWLTPAEDLVAAYFSMEDPRCLEPAGRELKLEVELPSGLVLRGFVDRLDQGRAGQLRVVDYKTGRPPGPGHEARAMFQMRFYALGIWRMRGEVPTVLQLMYLATGEVLRYTPDETDLLAMERKVEALWTAIAHSMRTGDWRANPSRACQWCSHQARCPEFGGTPPPLPTGPS